MFVPATVPSLALRLSAAIVAWLPRARPRPLTRRAARDLSGLDDHLLRDVGLL